MREPDNHTAVIDRFGDTWVRADDTPGDGNWWPMCDGPGWEPWARDGVGTPRTWDLVEVYGEYGPFTQAGPDRAARALERVRKAAA